jgi:hypothetical protein
LSKWKFNLYFVVVRLSKNKFVMGTTKITRYCKLHSRSQEVRKFYPDGRSGYRGVPWLRIGGLWMEKHGFKVGDPIEITVEKGVMTIKKLRGHGNR